MRVACLSEPVALSEPVSPILTHVCGQVVVSPSHYPGPAEPGPRGLFICVAWCVSGPWCPRILRDTHRPRRRGGPTLSTVSLPLSDPESLPPVAVDGVLACDLNLLDSGTDLSFLAILLFPLPASMLLVPLLPSDQPSTSTPERPSRQEQRTRAVSPSAGRDPLTPTALRWTLGITLWCLTGLQGCPYCMTSYAGTDTTDVNPVHGIQLHHPRFLEFIGAPESACFAEPVPGLLRPDHGSGRRCCSGSQAPAWCRSHDLKSSNAGSVCDIVQPHIFRSPTFGYRAGGFPLAAVDVLSPVPMNCMNCFPDLQTYAMNILVWSVPAGISLTFMIMVEVRFCRHCNFAYFALWVYDITRCLLLG